MRTGFHSFLATFLALLLLSLQAPSSAGDDKRSGLPTTPAGAEGAAGDALETLYRAGRDDELALAVQSELKKDYFEVPNFEPYFYAAYLDFKKHHLRSAVRGLAQFKCMLRVDSGAQSCSRSTFDHKSLCFQTMCAEMYLSYYSHPSSQTIAADARDWKRVRELEARIREAQRKRQ